MWAEMEECAQFSLFMFTWSSVHCILVILLMFMYLYYANNYANPTYYRDTVMLLS